MTTNFLSAMFLVSIVHGAQLPCDHPAVNPTTGVKRDVWSWYDRDFGRLRIPGFTESWDFANPLPYNPDEPIETTFNEDAIARINYYDRFSGAIETIHVKKTYPFDKTTITFDMDDSWRGIEAADGPKFDFTDCTWDAATKYFAKEKEGARGVRVDIENRSSFTASQGKWTKTAGPNYAAPRSFALIPKPSFRGSITLELAQANVLSVTIEKGKWSEVTSQEQNVHSGWCIVSSLPGFETFRYNSVDYVKKKREVHFTASYPDRNKDCFGFKGIFESDTEPTKPPSKEPSKLPEEEDPTSDGHRTALSVGITLATLLAAISAVCL